MVVKLKTKKKPTLSKTNYYSDKMNQLFWSNSLYQQFIKCEAKALHDLEYPVERAPAVPLLVGNYVHSFEESKQAHESFVNFYSNFEQVDEDGNTEILDLLHSGKKKKRLLAPFQVAENMINRLENDKLFQYFYNDENCKKESIVTGNLFGATWKGKIDSLNVTKGYFCDIKTVDDLNKKHWSVAEHKYVSFFKDRHYATQMGMYKIMLQIMYHKPFSCYVFAVDKTQGNGLVGIEVPFDEMQEAVLGVGTNFPHVLQVKNHEIEPQRCEHCEYCKSTHQLTGFINDPEELIY